MHGKLIAALDHFIDKSSYPSKLADEGPRLRMGGRHALISRGLAT